MNRHKLRVILFLGLVGVAVVVCSGLLLTALLPGIWPSAINMFVGVLCGITARTLYVRWTENE